ncbi:MAG: aspartate aminotransferase family protein [Actinobacteria bacterium]|nr:aspartate aminotransferase family protein [Actinomycetota bacterium]
MVKDSKDNNLAVFEEGSKYLMATYSRLPVVFTRAKMQYLWDANGDKYLDFIAGYGCLNVGHSNRLVVNAIKKQVENIIQPSNIYYNTRQVRLAEMLCNITGFGSKVFFANSGTEAVEGAVKLARKYSKEKYGQNRFKIISFNRSFHGRTMGALSATAQEEKQRIYQPLLGGFDYANLNDIDSVAEKIDNDTCAVIIEPVQGEGGINVSDNNFMKSLRELCSKKRVLLILDEVQTGFARTGRMFAYENYDIVPDILVLAKSLGGGMPLGAIVTNDEISSVFTPGSHGSTFGGNAASCAAGIAVIEYIIKNRLAYRAFNLGKYFAGRLAKLKKENTIIKDIRGLGLMIGLELLKPVAGEIVERALKDKIVINKISPSTLRFLPTLVISKKNIDTLIKWLSKNLKNFQA